jgi:hypothetical protein
METSDKDPELIDFFAELSSKDAKVKLPDLPKTQTKMFNWLLPMGVAASVLLGVFFFNHQNQEDTLLKDQVVITMYGEGNEGDIQFEIKEVSSIDTWEPATQSLLEGF